MTSREKKLIIIYISSFKMCALSTLFVISMKDI